MDVLTTELKGNVSSTNEDTHILLVGSNQTKKLKKSLESESESLIVSEAKDDTEIEAMVGVDLPDVIVAVTDSGTSPDIFNKTLLTLCRMEMNTRTIIVSDNPFRFLRHIIPHFVLIFCSPPSSLRDLISRSQRFVFSLLQAAFGPSPRPSPIRW